MPTRILGIAMVLAGLVACRDGPEEVVAPTEIRMGQGTNVTISVDVTRITMDAFDDLFVRELMHGLGIDMEALDRALRDLSTYRTEDQVIALSRILSTTRNGLPSTPEEAGKDGDQEILWAALDLVLDDAARSLEGSLAGDGWKKRGLDVTQH